MTKNFLGNVGFCRAPELNAVDAKVRFVMCTGHEVVFKDGNGGNW